MKKFFGLVLCCCGLLSCTTKDGNLVSVESGAGGLVVQASVSRGRIFINYRDTGREAPAVFEALAAGRHVVHLFLSGHRAIPDSQVVEIEAGIEKRVEFELRQSSSIGNLLVKSVPAGALVRIDRLPLGRTPLALNGLLSGEHHLSLQKGGYEPLQQRLPIQSNQTTAIELYLRRRPALRLVEHFSNTDCAPCPEADRVIEAVLLEKGADSVAVISYHPDFPGRQDPFFLAAQTENLARYGYYSRPPLPFVVVDGRVRLAGTTNLETRFRQALASRAGREAEVMLDFEGLQEKLQTAQELTGSVRLETIGDLTASTAVLHIALIEREITLAVAPGSNGQKRFFDVMRAFYPSVQGTPLMLAPGQNALVTFHFTKKPEWTGDLQVVAFVQNSVTGEVLQAHWSAGR